MNLTILVGSILFPAAAFYMLELGFGRLPLMGSYLAKVPRWFREKYVFLLLWPFKTLWGLMGKGAQKTLEAAWRGFVIVLKRLFAAAWRGVMIILAAVWSRLRGRTP